jgi:hypothetical protein
MKIGAADAASAHPQQHVPRPQTWICDLDDTQRTFGNSLRTRQKSGFHGGVLAAGMMPEILRLLPSSLVCNPPTATVKKEENSRKHRASDGQDK